MNGILRNILAIILGWFGGSIINMGLVRLGHIVFPIDGIDLNDINTLVEVIPTLDAQYFIFPFLAHALGTFIGAFLAGYIAINHKMKFSMAIGVLFLIGGIFVNYMIPGPLWFAAVDIISAYIPTAWLGGKIAMRLSNSKG